MQIYVLGKATTHQRTLSPIYIMIESKQMKTSGENQRWMQIGMIFMKRVADVNAGESYILFPYKT
jgi:hypothetical protein